MKSFSKPLGIFLLCITSYLLSGCASPYADHLNRLDADYAAGRIPPHAYYPMRAQILEAENQLRANRAAAFRASMANMNEQNSINAYNSRTAVMAQPQTVNVRHSGTVNHSIYQRQPMPTFGSYR